MSGYQTASTSEANPKRRDVRRATQLLSEILIAAGYSPHEVEIDEREFEEIPFSMGESLGSQARTAADSGYSSSLISDFFLIGWGRVRLLVDDPNKERKVSLTILDDGRWFGTDGRFFPEKAIGYIAIGASEGCLYRASSEIFENLLKRYPKLVPYLSASIREYQRVAFFRTQALLSSLTNKQIREIANQGNDIEVPAGCILEHFLNDDQGLYYLRSGQLRDQKGGVIDVGTSWWGRDALPTNSEAITDLLIYHLPISEVDETVIKESFNRAQKYEEGFNVPPVNSALAFASKASKKDVGDLIGGRVVESKEITPQVTDKMSYTSPHVVFPKPLKRKILDKFQRYPWIEQQSSSDCGAACLAMIARYWGESLPIHLLREKANVDRTGASLKNLAKGAESIGFNARPVRASFGRIAEQKDPWIAHWQGNHYIVVYCVEARRVVIADPAFGKKSMSRDEFLAHWTGYALLLEPTERLKDNEFQQASLGRYLKLLVPYRSLIVQILTVSLLIQIFSLVTPLFTQIILDKVVVRKSMSTLNVFAIGLAIFSAWTIMMNTARGYLLAYFSMRLDLTMVSGFIKHAISLPLKFYETRRVGDIITRVQENQKIQRFLISRVMLAWLGFLTGFVYLGLMLYYNLRLTLMVVALMPLIIGVTLISTPFLRQISREVFKESANQNSTLVEMISGISTIKSVGVEQEIRWRWEDSLIRFKNVEFKGQRWGIGLEAINGAINALGSTALLWIGAAMVIQDQLTIGQFVAFNMMIGYVLNPIVELSNLWDELQEIFISVERLNDVFETETEEPSTRSFFTLPTIKGNVLFDHVTFRYDEVSERNVLENLSFQVEAGQSIAIVGRSGSGKTTLIKLLEGLYHPTQGRILIDGHDIRHVSPYSLRTQLGVVPQECFLFSGTILENITLYRQDYPLEKVVEVAKLAEAHAFIQELPLGYNTKVGERGTTLSGGQKQRIAIARALLGHPQLLILDEATSSLDTESERRFQRNLSQISRDRTTFIIAHRLSTVRNADQILVLDHGLIIEQGDHDLLIQQKGLYWSLAQQQLNI